MRGVKKGLSALLLIMVFTLSCTLSVFAETAYITTSDGGSVNLRSQASTDSSPVNVLEDGTEVEVIETDGEWTKVSCDGYTGYVMTVYLTTASDEDTDTEEDTDSDTSDSTAEASSSDTSVTVGSVTYTIASELPEGVLPTDYTEVNIEYSGAGYGGAKNSDLGISLLYLISDSYSGLFIYDSSDDSFLPYLTVGSDEHNVTVLEIPSGFEMPEGYDSVTISTDGTNLLTAYQLSDPGTFDDTDLYIVYGISNSGTEGWYVIDTDENTYVRCGTPEDITVTDSSSDASDTTDSDKLDQYKKLLMILALACLILLIIIINLLLFYRRGYDDDYDDEEEEEEDEADSYEGVRADKDNEDAGEPLYEPVKIPEDTREIDVPDISQLVNDTTAEVIGDTESADDPIKAAAALQMQEMQEISETQESKNEDFDLEFFDLDDL